ncbi:MMPL family transporter [Nocardioides ferulae]|uniref:MMPL family transporter n=1 Tax=Nocardioides ferulae TaxID=2340821 RepID=UPI000EB58C07|nr:MMPL family transporter [Nocardioides ferulae]
MSRPRSLSAVPLRATRWSAQHPWRAILGWLVLVVAAVAAGSLVSTQEAQDEDWRHGESGRAEALVAEAGLEEPPSESVLITARSGPLDVGEARRAAADLAAAIGTLAGVDAVSEPMVGGGGDALLVSVTLDPDLEDAGPIVAATEEVAAAHPGLVVRQAGELTVDGAIDDRVADDLRSAELTSVPVTLLLMLLAFGALIAAGLPVLLAATSVAATIGLMVPISHLVPNDPTVTSMVVLVGMAVGVDYSLFYLKRERQERAAGRTHLDAVEIAAATSGHAILVSGGAVICSMAGLFVLGDATFNSLAVGSILVVAIAVLGSITVLPALLARLGRWVDRPRVPLLWRLTSRVRRGSVSGRLLTPVVRHPVAALAVSVLAVGAMAWPVLGMKTHSSSLETLPGSIGEVQTLRAITTAFPSEGTVAEVVVHAPREQRAEVEQALLGLEERAAASPLLDGAEVPVRVSEDGQTSLLLLSMPYDESDPRVEQALELLRTDLAPAAVAGVAGAEVAVGGDAASSVDFAGLLRERLPVVVGLVLLLTLLVMGTTFRSVPIALVSAALNLASVGVAFGLMTLVFQHGHLEGLLDFTSPGFVISWLPVFVLVVLVGLSMDYHVFVLSRVRELVDAGVPSRLAVRRGIADTAGVVTSAAAVMVSVFAIFATLSMLEMKMMGVALSVAILLDATLVRLVMLPAVLVLLGDRAWWPARPAPAAVDRTTSGVEVLLDQRGDRVDV